MANTASHTASDIDAMTNDQLKQFVATPYNQLQEYAKVLQTYNDQTNAGMTTAAAASLKHAKSKRPQG